MRFRESVKEAAVIAESLQERQQIIKVMTFLQSYGVSVGYAARIYRRYGDDGGHSQ